MKYKYTFLKNRLFYDEILIPYLDKMSKKGWNLVSKDHTPAIVPQSTTKPR